MENKSMHNFHIPVLGTGFSIDTPLKVARYGISSVISLADDMLMERLRRFYLEKREEAYVPITDEEEDSRAKRITAYLNMVNRIAKEQFHKLKESAFESGSEMVKYFSMLPDLSALKIRFNEMLVADNTLVADIQKWLRENIRSGEIDVNIMTKLDKANYDSHGNQLPVEYNDAHAALRGFAKSELESSVVLSAGMNPKLFSYMETFNDFYPASDGRFKKKIIIKVSDFRSAFIQGRFLAKKGLWVSEYRIESGLNCGGHAFATDGYLLGPILEEFKEKKEELLNSVTALYTEALNKKNRHYNIDSLKIEFTVQGGVGNSAEHNFLIRKYGVKSVGWGTPFLLVPEVMNVDKDTLEALSKAGEDDVYLSNVSPLGVPFNYLRGSKKELEKIERIENGKPGSLCPKKYITFNKEFSDKPLCTASITYINKKIKELKEKLIFPEEYKKEVEKVTDKVCLCLGLGASALSVNDIETPKTSNATAVCPGPNIAYFSKIATLKEMVDHIYDRINLITAAHRPNMFIKELSLYIDYFMNKLDESIKPHSAQVEEYFNNFHNNLVDGINYYKNLIPELKEETIKAREKIIQDLEELENKIISKIFVAT